jgi:hypothetical protein
MIDPSPIIVAPKTPSSRRNMWGWEAVCMMGSFM